MLGSLLIALREGMEAALVIGIILAYLARTGNRRGFRPVWLGLFSALAVSLLAGGIIYVVAGDLSGRAEPIFEGSVLLIAVGVLTWMIFWMRRQAINIRGHLHAQLQAALTGGSSLGLAAIAFAVVVREGIEMALFLFAATRVAESFVLFAAGTLLGLAGATAIGYLVYKGSTRLNLRTFFNVTSLLLIIFGAGLLVRAIGEFQEVGLIPAAAQHIWDTSRALSEDSTAGKLLVAIFGYVASPSLLQVVAYVAYLGGVLIAYFRPSGSRDQQDGKRAVRVQEH